MLAALLGACGGGPVGVEDDAPVRLAGGGGAAARTLDAALVGTWSRVVVFANDLGAVIVAETYWTFLADGRAERRVVTSNATVGLADQIVTLGEWFTERDGTLVVRRVPDGATLLRAPYRVEPRLDGAQLVLDGLAFQRFTP